MDVTCMHAHNWMVWVHKIEWHGCTKLNGMHAHVHLHMDDGRNIQRQRLTITKVEETNLFKKYLTWYGF